MKHLALMVTLIFATCSAWSGTNLLDLMKAGKTKYSTVSCQKFIQSANHTTLKAPELAQHTVKLKNFKFLDDYYFHYSDAAILKSALDATNADRVAAQRSIVQKGGYKSIMEYQMTYSDALSNAKGVGFYVAANPFSSASYGDTQVALRFSQMTTIIDATAKNAQIMKVIIDKSKINPDFARCNANLQFSLLMNENGIDMALYSDSYEWLVVFNEDVIIQSKVTPVFSEDVRGIMTEMSKNGLADALIEYISELGMHGSYKISLANFETMLPAAKAGTKSTLLKVAGYIKNWNDAAKVNFAKMISSKKAAEMNALMNEFKVAKLITDDVYFKIPLAQASDDFLANIVARVKKTPALAKGWGDYYNDNMTFLFKKSQIDLKTYLANFPSAAKRAEFFTTYTSKGFSAEQNSQILDHMISTDPSYFKGLTKDAQASVFYTFLKNAKPEKISAFVATLDRLGFDHSGPFSYVVSRPYSFGANGLTYLSAYIKLKKNPALLTDNLINSLTSRAEFNSTEFMIYLKQNQAAFGAGASKFAKSSLSVMEVKFYDALITPVNSRLFSQDEKDLMLKRILLDDVEGSKIVSKFLSTFAYNAASVAAVVGELSSSNLRTTGSSVVTAIKVIEADALEWSKFTNFSNAKGMMMIVNHPRMAVAKSYVLDRTQAVFLRDPAQISKLPAQSRSLLVNASKVQPYFASYTEDQKMAVALMMKTYSPSDADQFMAQVTFSPALVAANFNALMSQDSDDQKDFEALLNNSAFVSSLDAVQFERLVVKALSFDKPVDLKTLIRSDVLNLERAMILAFRIKKSHGEDNVTEIADHQLSFDTLSDADKKVVMNKYIQDLAKISSPAKTALWKRVFDLSITEKTSAAFLNLTDSMGGSLVKEVLDYYTSTPALIEEGLNAMTAGRTRFYEIVLENDSVTSVTAILSHIETNYPVQEKYYESMIKNYGAYQNTHAQQKAHLDQFVCKKVKKFNAFSELIDAQQDKESKKQYKDLRKQICEG